MLVDQKLKVLVPDDKPQRVCRFSGCSRSSYEGINMRVCSRCKFVRYCGKDCQRGDWPNHKSKCHVPPNVDIRAWLSKYHHVFEWAALQAMGSKPTEHLASTHHLAFDVIRTDRVQVDGGPAPMPFVMHAARLSLHADFGPVPWYSKHDVETSLQIQSKGGVGRVLAIFRVIGIGAPLIMLPERYDLDTPMVGAPCAGWAGVVKGIVNEALSFSEVVGATQGRYV